MNAIHLTSQVLQLRQDELAKVSSGHLINLVSKDMQAIPIMVTYVPSLFFSVAEMLLLVPLLWLLAGKETLAGLAFVLFVGLSTVIGSKILLAPLRRKTTFFTDKRLGLVEAAISGIRVVKMNAWELLFKDWIGQARRYFIKYKLHFLVYFFLKSSGSKLLFFIQYMKKTTEPKQNNLFWKF